jgi:hypothetical protein
MGKHELIEARAKLIHEKEWGLCSWDAVFNTEPLRTRQNGEKEVSRQKATADIDWFLAHLPAPSRGELREKIAEQLAIQALEDESLAGCFVWQWVKENNFEKEWLDKADSILALLPMPEVLGEARKLKM